MDTKQAAEGLKKSLVEQGLTDVEVTVGAGTTNEKKLGHVHDGMHDEITIKLQGQIIEDLDFEVMRRKAYAALNNFEKLRQHVQLEETGEHLDKLRARLESFIAKGAKIPAAYLNWGGFDKELNKDNDWFSSNTEDHSIRFPEGSAFNVNFDISIPETKQTKDKETALETGKTKVDANINERISDIKALLALRLEKYLDAKGDAAKIEIKKKVEDLTIEFKDGRVTIMSPEQKAESDRKKDPKAEPLKPEEEKKLAETNILSRLTKEQLGKALGRAFLHSGTKADEIFPIVAGREDMKRAIERQLKILKYSEAGQKDPGLAKAVDEFLADDVFKKHDWEEQNKLRKEPVFKKSSDPDKKGTATITLSLPRGEATQIIAAFNSTQPQTPESQAAQAIVAGGTPATWAEQAQAEKQKANEAGFSQAV